MTTLQFYETIVLPTVEELNQSPSSRRRAYLACIVVSALKDYIQHDLGHRIDEELKHHAYDAYNVVLSVSNGAKHRTVDRNRKMEFDSGDDFYRPPAFLGKFAVGISFLGDQKGGRSVKDNGRHFDILRNVKVLCSAYLELYPQLFR